MVVDANSGADACRSGPHSITAHIGCTSRNVISERIVAQGGCHFTLGGFPLIMAREFRGPAHHAEATCGAMQCTQAGNESPPWFRSVNLLARIIGARTSSCSSRLTNSLDLELCQNSTGVEVGPRTPSIAKPPTPLC